jgi:hypothetical protein
MPDVFDKRDHRWTLLAAFAMAQQADRAADL